MSTEERNVAAMRAIYDAYARKDASVFFNSIAEGGAVGFAAGKRHFKFGGMWRGRRGAEQVIGHIAADLEWLKFECREVIAQGDRVVALTGGKIRDRKSGRVADLDLVDVVQLRDGKIVDFVEHFDSAALRDLMAPVPSKTQPRSATKAKPKAKKRRANAPPSRGRKAK